MIRRLALLLLLLSHAGTAPAQEVRGCLQRDGSVVYTDGLCAVDQSEQSTKKAEATAPAPGARPVRQGIAPPPACSRNPDELLWAVRAALDARDVNVLAKSYHWTGASSAQAEAVMIRLEALARTPPLDARLVYAEETAEAEDGGYDAAEGHGPRPRAPAALKVVTPRDDGGARTESTLFRLQRHFGCWWIRY